MRVIFLTAFDPKLYAKNLLADASDLPSGPPSEPGQFTRKEFFAKLGRPVKNALD